MSGEQRYVLTETELRTLLDSAAAGDSVDEIMLLVEDGEIGALSHTASHADITKGADDA